MKTAYAGTPRVSCRINEVRSNLIKSIFWGDLKDGYIEGALRALPSVVRLYYARYFHKNHCKCE
jgi:hypothetical protein